jgi:fumarate reductase flavoprotein subunit
MKYVLFSFVSFMAVFLVVTGCAVFGGIKSLEQAQIEQKEQEPDKVYEGSSFGYRGPIYVQVSLSGGSISEITVVDSDEDRFVGGAAMEELIETVIELNSADVDAVSGATITSKGFLEAVRNAIMSYE